MFCRESGSGTATQGPKAEESQQLVNGGHRHKAALEGFDSSQQESPEVKASKTQDAALPSTVLSPETVAAQGKNDLA